MATYMHGTTARGLEAILKGTSKPESPWTCSDRDGQSYLWDAEAIIEGEDADAERVIQMAFESAQIQAAVDAEDTMMYVLEVSLDASDVEPDWSCENMADYARVVGNAMLTRETIKRVYRCEFSKWDAPFVLTALIHNNHFNASAVKDERLIVLAEALGSEGVFREEVLEFDWVDCGLPA